MFLDTFSIWYIYPIVLFIGFTWVVYDPSKISLGMKLVDEDSISNIFGMWICGFNIPRILSSILAGYLIVYLGAKYALLLESLMILSAFLSIWFLKYEHPVSQNSNISTTQIYIDIKNLFTIIKNNNLLIGFFLLSFKPILLLIPSTTGLLPVYASDILNFEIWKHFSGLIGISISTILVGYINLFTEYNFKHSEDDLIDVFFKILENDLNKILNDGNLWNAFPPSLSLNLNNMSSITIDREKRYSGNSKINFLSLVLLEKNVY